MKVYTVLDLMQNPLEELVLEQLSEAPSNGVQGQIYYNTVTNNIEYYNGSQWESINNFSSFTGIMNSQGFLNFVANGAFKWYSSGIPLNWTTGGSVLSNTTISQFAIGANVSGYLNRFTINGNTGTGTVYLQQGINVKGISDLILSLKTQTNNSNLEIFVNVIGYSGENFTGTTNTWNLTQNIPLNVITPITLDISGYFGNYESLEIQIGANVIGTGLSNVTLDIGEISLYHSSGELNLPYQASLYDVFNILTDNNLILNNLTTNGNTTLGNASGDTVKTYNNTLDDGNGGIDIIGNSYFSDNVKIKRNFNFEALINNYTQNELFNNVILLGTYTVGTNPEGVAIYSSGNVWVANYGSASVSKLSSAGALLGTYTVGTNPYGIAIDSSGNVWVANSGSANVSKLSSAGALLGTYTVGTNPHGIAIDSSGNVWVANNGSTTVSKIVFIPQPQLKVPLVLNII